MICFLDLFVVLNPEVRTPCLSISFHFHKFTSFLLQSQGEVVGSNTPVGTRSATRVPHCNSLRGKSLFCAIAPREMARRAFVIVVWSRRQYFFVCAPSRYPAEAPPKPIRQPPSLGPPASSPSPRRAIRFAHVLIRCGHRHGHLPATTCAAVHGGP